MKQAKDQFGNAFAERQETLMRTTMGSNHVESQPQSVLCTLNKKEAGAAEVITYQKSPSASPSTSTRMKVPSNKVKEEDEENEENRDTEHRLPSSSDPHKIVKIHNGSGGDGLLQWGQRKRSKRTAGEKHAGIHSMLPPPPPPVLMACGSRGGGTTKLRPHSNGVVYAKDASSSLVSSKSKTFEDRTMDDASNNSSSRNGGGIRSASRSALGKRSHSTAERTDKKVSSSSYLPCGSLRREKSNESLHSEQTYGTHVASLARLPPETDNDRGVNGSNSNGVVVGEMRECPRLYIALSRKEKEEDFYAMKGTKLPHRPKKRAKAVERTLQYCFPGMWLSDLTKARYEVRERKTVKKPKRRGLKGLENMVESDSE